jgi:hypothetical protein
MPDNLPVMQDDGIPSPVPTHRIRGYQQEMLDESLKRNIIIALDTGAGKTHIAVLRMIEAERKSPKVRSSLLRSRPHDIFRRLTAYHLPHPGLVVPRTDCRTRTAAEIRHCRSFALLCRVHLRGERAGPVEGHGVVASSTE